MPRVKFTLMEDGSLSGAPTLTNPSSEPGFQQVAESAMRAVRVCKKFNIPAKFAPFYNDWRDMTIVFDPREMLG
jgi:hypothetical protein